MEMITIACTCVLLFELNELMNWIKWKLKIKGRIKPFDCGKCMAWWIGLIYFGIKYKNVESIYMAGTTSLLAAFMVLIYRKIYDIGTIRKS